MLMLKQIKNFLSGNKYLALIIILAASLRFVALGDVPPSLNWDEVSHGYNAYSILKTGKDEWGKVLPAIFRAYGDYKLPVYIYATVPSVAIFGLNAFAVRLPSVLAGIGTVVFTYFLVIELFNKNGQWSPKQNKFATGQAIVNGQKLTAAIAALLVAIEPWSFFLSRPAFEANLALFLFIAGAYYFLKGLHQPIYYLPSTVFLGLTVWTYNSYRIFTPLMILVLVVLHRKRLLEIYRKRSKLITYCLLIIAFFFLPMLWQLAKPAGQARYEWVSIIDQGAIATINEQRNTADFSPLVSRLFYNKGTYFAQQFTKNYLSHFTLGYLFFEGGSHFQFSLPGNGLIYPINSAFFLIGLLYLLKRRSPGGLFIVSWLLLAPVPSSLTREAPHVLRSITFLPIPMIVSALGVGLSAKKISEVNLPFTGYQLLIGIYLIFLFFSTRSYLDNYLTDYKNSYSWSWQYGYEQMVDYVKEAYGDYDKIVITKNYGEPHEFFLFHWPWSPDDYRNDPNLVRFYQSNWYWVDSFDKFYFINDWQVDEEGTNDYEFRLESERSVWCSVDSVRCLLVTSPENIPEGWQHIETIDFLSGEPAFEIYKNR